ncbi:hypothetical protein KY316_01815, partial [Candidatus Woesearchaeota archaeon]|nr:hypothetical protein [Candidatus Woesearchaeota archaeon]
VAEAVLNAADKGVQVIIRNDISGCVYEHTPGRVPLLTDADDFKTSFLKSFYSKEYRFLTLKNFDRLGKLIAKLQKRPNLKPNENSSRMKSHNNIHLMNLPFFNHGKAIVIDGNLAYVGGQCISNDYTQWVDYCHKIRDKKYVEHILIKLMGHEPEQDNAFKFVTNPMPKNGEKVQSIHQFTINFIRNSKEPLYIEMAYMGEDYIKPILELLKNNIDVHILASKKSDANQHRNIDFLKILLRKSGNSKHLHIAMSNDLIHTKGLVTKNRLLSGSNNFSTSNGYELSVDEQNIYTENQDIVKPFFEQFRHDFEHADLVSEAKDLPKYSIIAAYKDWLGFLFYAALSYSHRSKIISARVKGEEQLKHVLRQQMQKDFYSHGWDELKQLLS